MAVYLECIFSFCDFLVKLHVGKNLNIEYIQRCMKYIHFVSESFKDKDINYNEN